MVFICFDFFFGADTGCGGLREAWARLLPLHLLKAQAVNKLRTHDVDFVLFCKPAPPSGLNYLRDFVASGLDVVGL